MISDAGSLVFWPNNEVTYYIDPGDLGEIPAEIAQQLVISAFEEWSNLEYSLFKWEYGGLIEVDVTAENFEQIREKKKNIVVFDSDGSIIDKIQGEGASDVVLGFSGPLHSHTGIIQYSEAVLNGKLLLLENQDISRAYSTILHEVGHFTGLDHTQLFTEFALDNDPTNNVFLPIMFPIEAEDQVSPTGLSLDDKITLSSLYPTIDFDLELGTIRGTVRRPNGQAVQGANVVLVSIVDPHIVSFAVVSDLNKSKTGEFTFKGIPPGNYEIYIEPIRPEFFDVAGVGPFTDTPTSPSFINPVVREYYNGERESGDPEFDQPDDRVVIEVRAGEIVTDINFISNEEQTSVVEEWTLF